MYQREPNRPTTFTCRWRLLCVVIGLLSCLRAPGYSSEQLESLPNVTFTPASPAFLQALNGDQYYTTSDAAADYTWLKRRATDLDSVWAAHGDSTLLLLHSLCGSEWREDKIEVLLVRFLTQWYLVNPLTLPLAGRRQGAVYEAGPFGDERTLQLVEIFAARLVDELSHLDTPQTRHPLFADSPFHRGALITHLTLSVGASLLTKPSFDSVFHSDGFTYRHPSLALVKKYLWGKWTLSGSNTLFNYLSAEPFDGAIVHAADSCLKALETSQAVAAVARSEVYSTNEGKLGLSVEQTSTGIRVTNVDTAKLAHAFGVLPGDVITNVNGSPSGDVRSFYRLLLNGYQTSGATLSILRADTKTRVTFKRSAKKQR